jgi:hypothetical protein
VWTDPNPANWSVERSIDGAAFVAFSPSPGGDRSYLDLDYECPGASSYRTRVRTKDGIVFGPYSNIVETDANES